MFGNDFNHYFLKESNATNLKFDGYQSLYALTKCLRPCQKVEYQLTQVFRDRIENSMDESVNFGKKFGDNSSSILIFYHNPKEDIKKIEEVPKYTAISFISDVGGILGVFLGVSFWSIHNSVIEPFISILENKIKR